MIAYGLPRFWMDNMRKMIFYILAVAAILVIGIGIWKIVQKKEIVSVVTYRSQFGYSLTMTADKDHTTVNYIDDGREAVRKDVDRSCYTNVAAILDTYDFPSWKKLSDQKARTEGFDTLEIRYEGGKTMYFSQSQDLPEQAQEMFSVLKSCLLEYAGIHKS